MTPFARAVSAATNQLEAHHVACDRVVIESVVESVILAMKGELSAGMCDAGTDRLWREINSVIVWNTLLSAILKEGHGDA